MLGATGDKGGILDAPPSGDAPGAESDTDDGAGDPKDSAAADVIDAVKSGDAAMLKDALEDFVRACMAESGGDSGTY